MKECEWNAIAAMDSNRVIGNGYKLPWNMPKDMEWFHAATKGHILVVGRKTFESIKKIYPENVYYILTRNRNYVVDKANVRIIHQVSEIPQTGMDGKKVWICGGSEIYAATIAKCRHVYITQIKRAYEGNKYFPAFERDFNLDQVIYEDDEISIMKYKKVARRL
ncbi:dihydrofolate reductase [Clostridium sp. Marseille-P2415]|uniref:dihydrofolate reductase n=1 Tax=Clostridium sp. Marseille-P2415 TaxID=1805471 RepID=UPI000988724A|nr:dihydrofolate reductase [Clostridium sp. Marseille-P2415]